MKCCAMMRSLRLMLLLLNIYFLYGCGNGTNYQSANTDAVAAILWHYENVAPDFLNNGKTCSLVLRVLLRDNVSSADVESFIVRAPNGENWYLPATGNQVELLTRPRGYALQLESESPHSFPLAGVWTVIANLKDGRTSTTPITFHDPGSSTDATFQYLYTPEDWIPDGDQSLYVPMLKRFPAVGFSFTYFPLRDGWTGIISTGFKEVEAAYVAAEPKMYNMLCWLYDENKVYLGKTIKAYGFDPNYSDYHASTGLVSSLSPLKKEIVFDPLWTMTDDERPVDLSLVKYIRIVVLDGAQFDGATFYDNRAISELIPVSIGSGPWYEWG